MDCRVIMQAYRAKYINRACPQIWGGFPYFEGYRKWVDAARRHLQSTIQWANESVTAYYHRLQTLWLRARVPERERVKKFKTSLNWHLASSISIREHHTVREALDDASRLEEAHWSGKVHGNELWLKGNHRCQGVDIGNLGSQYMNCALSSFCGFTAEASYTVLSRTTGKQWMRRGRG